MTSADGSTLPPVTPADAADVVAFPASGVQRGLWFLDRLTPGQPTYNVVTAFECLGELRVDALQRAIDTLVERHESLRTTFASQDGEPLQIIHPALAVPVVVVPAGAPATADAEALARAAAEAATPFDLGTGPLLRVRVFAIEARRQLLVITAHHIVFDGWSVAVFCAELGTLYRASLSGAPSPLPPVDIQYADYVQWQQQRLTPDRVATQLDYWRATLATAGEPVEIASRPRPARPSGRGATVTWTLDARATEGLRRLCRAEQATTFMAVVALLDVLLARHTGAEELMIGTPLASRPRPELEQTLGFFANTVVIRTDLSGAPTFREVLRRVKGAALGAMAHADVPFEQVVQAVQPVRGLGGQVPLFRVMVAVQRVPEALIDLAGLDARLLRLGSGTAKFDLLLDVQERTSDIELAFEYSTDVIDDDTCRRWQARLTQLLEAACAAPDTLIAELPVVTADEARDLARWNATAVSRDETATPVSLVARQAARTPDAVAVSHGADALTYQALDRRANQLAHALRTRGVQRGTRVALALDRSIDLAVAVLGVLKAGAAYVPIDPAYPIERIRFMVEDADVRAVLAPPALAATILGSDTDPRGFSDWVTVAAACPATPPDGPPMPADACYVMYTSGSTGQPKGVVMPHVALANLLDWQGRRSAPGLSTLQFSALSFDVSFQEHFATWASGGRLVLIADAARRDPRQLLETLRAHAVERLFLPFVALQLLADTAMELHVVPSSLREVITAGEQLRITPALRWLFAALRGATLDNQYGPTETHVVTAHRLSGDPAAWPELPPIGRPIDNVQVLLLDAAQRPVPPGVTGELWLAGAGLADGYHQRPDLTADRFRTIAVPGYLGRAYRSGDAGRHSADGAIEFLGRRDDQVKIRGFRVEPGEIEAALETHPQVRQAVVVARRDDRGTRLVAYYVAAGEVTDAILRAHLGGRLPDYMVPAAWVPVTSFPQTPSGKVDRRRLPDETAPVATAAAASEPQDEMEAQLLAIWREVLQAPALSAGDDFFAHGGHSLAAARLFTLVEKRLGQTLPLSAIYDYPTVATLAGVLREHRPASSWPALHVLVEGPGRPIFCVHSISGDIMEYRALADAIGADQPFIGIRAKLGEDVADVYATIEATAASYVADLIAYQPKGPYMLAGWSAGGTVAFEMAQQLRASGREVSLLAVLDNAPFNTGYEPPRTVGSLWRQARNVPAWIRDDLAQSRPSELLARVRQKLLMVVRKAAALLRRTEDQADIRDVVAFPESGERWETFVAAHYRALLAYVPRHYDGRVTVFKAQTHPLLRLHDADAMWRMVASQVDVFPVTGTHFSIVKDPHVRALGASVRKAIEQAAARTSAPATTAAASR